MQQAVEQATATDPDTLIVEFKIPAPRFFFFMTYKYDIGVYIVPKHVFDGQDWTTSKHFDPSRNWPVSTAGRSSTPPPQQKILDRRASWWAAERKLAPLPAVKRNIWLPSTGEQQSAQALIVLNQLDAGPVMQPATFQTLFRGNHMITTHTGQEAVLRLGYRLVADLALRQQRAPAGQ